MVIVRQWGGLGNQMFIDSYVQALICRGIEVKIDLSYYDYFKGEYLLDSIFGITRPIASHEECNSYGMYKLDYYHRFVKKYLFPLLKKHTHHIVYGYANHEFHEEYLNINDGYVEGYFQAYKYFYNIRNVILKNFIFPELDSLNCKILEKIKNTTSVSIHVRRGDYINQDDSFHVCGEKYYDNAISYIMKVVKEPSFFVFSNDIEWCKQHLHCGSSCYYVDVNSGRFSYRDMQLMRECKHNIIANSTFSWWGAWLNCNNSKIVCAPDIWFAPSFRGDIIPDSWIPISHL